MIYWSSDVIITILYTLGLHVDMVHRSNHKKSRLSYHPKLFIHLVYCYLINGISYTQMYRMFEMFGELGQKGVEGGFTSSISVWSTFCDVGPRKCNIWRDGSWKKISALRNNDGWLGYPNPGSCNFVNTLILVYRLGGLDKAIRPLSRPCLNCIKSQLWGYTTGQQEWIG